VIWLASILLISNIRLWWPSKTFNNNERYDIKTNKWITEAPMPTSRHGLGAASVENKIYVIGGGPQPGLSVTNANEIFHVTDS
jgi:N-acetylneuraminic acid mutarotase